MYTCLFLHLEVCNISREIVTCKAFDFYSELRIVLCFMLWVNSCHDETDFFFF